MTTSDHLPPPAFDAANPGHWKLALLLSGVGVSAELAEEFERATGVAVTRRLLLELPRGLLALVQVHVNGASRKDRPVLDFAGDAWALRFQDATLPVTVRPPIEVGLRGRVVRVDDYVLCDLSHESWGARLRAHFGFVSEHAEAAPRTLDPVLDALEEVARRRTLRGIHVLAYGDPKAGDAESPLETRADLFAAIHRNFATALSIECWPPESVRPLEAAYASGVDLLYFHLASGLASRASLLVPEREFLTLERYGFAFDGAREIFEGGALKSALLLDGKTSAERMMKSVRRLLKDGVVPLFWLAPGGAPAPWEHVAQLLALGAAAMEKSKVSFSRVEEAALHIPPAELKYFHPEGKPIFGGLQGAAHTGLGRVAQRNLSALRRHLRVRGGEEQ